MEYLLLSSAPDVCKQEVALLCADEVINIDFKSVAVVGDIRLR